MWRSRVTAVPTVSVEIKNNDEWQSPQLHEHTAEEEGTKRHAETERKTKESQIIPEF